MNLTQRLKPRRTRTVERAGTARANVSEFEQDVPLDALHRLPLALYWDEEQHWLLTVTLLLHELPPQSPVYLKPVTRFVGGRGARRDGETKSRGGQMMQARGLALVPALLALASCGGGGAPHTNANLRHPLEAQLHLKLRHGAPPSGGSDPIKWVQCARQSDHFWTCDVRDDISVLPDITTHYEVTVRGRCWRARIAKTGQPSEDLVAQGAHACLP